MNYNPWSSLATIPRGVWIICAAALVNRAGTMVLPFLTLYCTQDRGYSPSKAGLALLVYGAGSIISAPISGRLSDRFGPLAVIRASLLSCGLLLLLLPVAPGYLSLLAFAFAWALAGEAYRPASSMLLSNAVLPAQRKSAFALYRLAINLGMSIGPPLGGLLVAKLSYHWLFWVDGATSILAGIVAWSAHGALRSPAVPAPQSPGDPENSAAAAASAEVPSAWLDRRMLFFMAALFPISIVFLQFEGAMSLYLVRDLGLAEWVFGSLLLVNTLLIIFIEIPLNLATSHWSHRRTLACGALLIALGFGALPLAGSVAAIALTVAVWTFGEMVLLPAASAYVADLAPPERRGSYMGAYHVTFSVAFAIGPWLGVTLFDQFGGTTVWLACLVVGCLSAVMFSRVARVEPT